MNSSNRKVNIGQGNLLHSVVEKGYIDIVNMLLNAGIEVYCRTIDDCSHSRQLGDVRVEKGER
jgi:hypothetical protein